MTRTVLFTTRSADVNPMYAKFRDKFSYQGATIGDYMREKAKNDGYFDSNRKSYQNVRRDITVESRITKANSLPRENGKQAPADYTAILPKVTVGTAERVKTRMPIGTIMVMFLCATILMLLIYIGMNVNNMTHEIALMKAQSDELQSTERSLTSRLDEKNDLEKIEFLATENLGMVRRASVEHSYISFGDSDSAYAFAAEKEDNPLISGLLSAFTAGFNK